MEYNGNIYKDNPPVFLPRYHKLSLYDIKDLDSLKERKVSNRAKFVEAYDFDQIRQLHKTRKLRASRCLKLRNFFGHLFQAFISLILFTVVFSAVMKLLSY